ncbi:DNA-binding response regulator [Lactobacillus nasalidis]|uniref:DNA-binding response regulator n=1 Tax=Lactobacillus nasalidis TaxID=2797258 RepID=A0ABQ3W8P9_9LACO|nr:response regulator transcription factor [Lactobacillus nasalidis]GHV96988.1 DNA-binding response regulator [Lactobacillus nasalidis]GHV99012.1 DNA-binding response regulator [Lactobacillus nasalidis]GHW02037.1 DNA-binding response regulator [Lactobacillus nasalidis]
MKGTILLVEDEPGLAQSLNKEFQFEGYQVILAGDGEQAVDEFEKFQAEISLVLLDWMLPKLDGLGVLRRIRRISQVPVIMLTARDYAGDKVSGLKSGADDYVTKPFDIEELLARMEAVLRRARPSGGQEEYSLKGLTLNLKSREVIREGQIIQLTQREFLLLSEFMRRAGQVLTRDELLDAVWGADFDGQPNTVDVYVRLLRQKIDRNFSEKLLHTVRGVGYMLK